jgi:predicted alpha/beta superfamily hydrolase
MRSAYLYCLVCFITSVVSARAEDPQIGASVFTMRSKDLNRDYQIRVSQAPANREMPVPTIFVLDGQWEFDLANAIYGGLRQDGFISEALIVGVCIPGTDEERRAIRSQDFAPNDSSETGKDATFRKFLCESVVPEIERRYACNSSNRTLVGWSMGGMFTVETMLSTPSSFRNYVAVSPALFWDRAHAIDRLKSAAFVTPVQPISLSMMLGEYEPPLFQTPFAEFAKELERLKFTDFELQVHQIEKERHFSTRAIAYGIAFKQILSARSVEVAEDVMKSVCGKYRPSEKQWEWFGEIEIGWADGKLWAERKFGGFEGRDVLVPISDSVFNGTRYGSEFEVKRDSDKTYVELKWEEFPSIKFISVAN